MLYILHTVMQNKATSLYSFFG